MRAEPFEVAVPQATLDDLERRLRGARWARDYANDDWRYGVNGDYLRELVEYWIDGYDWRAQERAMNALSHYRVEIEGLPIHFVHERGKGENPIPIVLTHGWPWTFWDMKDLIGPLTDPAAHGGDPADCFDVIVPSLPGFGFSTPLEKTGVHWWKTADLWVSLMRDALGYERFAAHGGDWGALVTMQRGHKYARELIGIHVTNAFPLSSMGGDRPWSIGDAAAQLAEGSDEREGTIAWEKRFVSHMAVHTLDPQTLAWGLTDSPIGLLAWILERRRNWSDCGGEVERRFTRDHLLTTIRSISGSIAIQGVSWRRRRAVDFRPVQGAVAADSLGNALAGLAGSIPNGVRSTTVSLTEITGVAARPVGVVFGLGLVALAFFPKLLALVLAIPGPVIAAYVTVMISTLFVLGMRMVIADGLDHRKSLIVGFSFWFGAGCQYGFIFPDYTASFAGGMLNSGLTAGGLAALLLNGLLELTGPRRRKIETELSLSALPRLREFVTEFASRQGWDEARVLRLEAVCEETLLILLEDKREAELDRRRLLVTVHREGGSAVLDFIAAVGEGNVEDRIALLDEQAAGDVIESEVSFRLLRHLASSVRHRQYHDADIVTVNVE